MSENSPNKCTPQLPNSGHDKIRYFYNDPSAGWQPMSVSRGEAIYCGKLRVPEWAGMTIRIGIAYIDVAADKTVTLRSLSISNWKIGDDGVADQDDQMRRIIEKIDGGTGDDVNSIATKDDAAAIRHLLGLSNT